jgi:uncharacterized protein
MAKNSLMKTNQVKEIVYFYNPGKENTEAVLSLAKERAEALGIHTIVVASTTGWSAVQAVKALKGFTVIIVTHSTGFTESNVQEFTEGNRQIVESKGAKILTATHVFGGLDRAMRQGSIAGAPATYVVGDIVATTLRIFGQGMKVACEISSMAADAGLVRTDEDIIALAGTGSPEAGRGLDYGIVLKPACSHLFFETQVKEIICKPH